MSKEQLNRAGALVLALALVGQLAACGAKEPTVAAWDDAYVQPEYLRFFSPTSLSGSDVGKYWSDRFSEAYHKEVYVEYDGASYYADEGLSYRELLEKRLQSGTPDDLYIISAEDVIEFENSGYWMDLSGLKAVDNLSEAALYQSTYNGKVFSIPLEFTGFGFYWNVDMLEEHGLDVPENLDQFWTACETLSAAGVLPYGGNKGYALTVPAMCAGLAALYGSDDLEDRLEDLNSGATPISTYLRDGFELLQQMLDRGYLDPQQALDTVPGDEWDLFLNGQCAFICIGLGNALQEPEKNSFQVAMTGAPVLPEGAVAVYGADARLCVNPNAKNLETALSFMEMVGTTDALDVSARLSNTLSTAENSAIPPPATETRMCELLQSPGQIPNQDFALHFNTWESIRNVGRALCGGIGVEAACAQLDELQRADLAAYAAS